MFGRKGRSFFNITNKYLLFFIKSFQHLLFLHAKNNDIYLSKKEKIFFKILIFKFLKNIKI
ncbi:hypothetical protein CAPGI0001_1477 [Capnocytophaga gingivalis ATCC 33624]|nr:hypothetical protein CAPGI0001_1477 [Capnocytophaga gingivalis ATCC 33624]